MKSGTVLAYTLTSEDLALTARRSGLYCATAPDGIAWCAMALEIYERFEPLGPVQLHFIGINKVEPGEGHGMALVLGYPNQELEEFPQLLDLGVHLFHSQPRRVTRVGSKGYDWTSPKEDGEGVDNIIMARQEPHLSNWSRFYRSRPA